MWDLIFSKETLGIVFFFFSIGSLNGLVLTNLNPFLLIFLAIVNMGVALWLVED